jgi:hypothetical protein
MRVFEYGLMIVFLGACIIVGASAVAVGTSAALDRATLIINHR